MRLLTKIFLAPAALVAFGSGAFAQDVPTPSISMDDVVVRGGEALEFSEVKMDQAGWIVVHNGVAGEKTGASLARVFVNPGVHQGVLVPIDGGYTTGNEYIVSLHYDSNGNGTWDNEENPANDGPVIRADGTPYVVPFITAPAK